jgi:hypothetical protein
VLGWDHSLIHWGSVSSGSAIPRISIAVEFLGARVNTERSEHPLLDTTALPTFEQRLYIIGKSISDYNRFEPLMNRFAEVAERLMARPRE